MLIVADRRRAVALAELLPIQPVDHRQVGEHRQLRAEGAIEHDLLRRVRDVIIAAHDERDAHRDVVAHDGEVVDRRAVGAQDDEVLDVLVRKGDLVVHEIGPRRRALGNTEADRERHAVGDATRDFLGREPIATPIVLEAVATRLGLRAALRELGLGAEAAIRRAVVEQTLRVGAVTLEVRALEDDLPVPREAEPLEPLEDGARALVGAARLVGVLDAQQEHSVELSRVEPVEERRPRAADVQIPRGRRCEAKARSRCGHAASERVSTKARHVCGGPSERRERDSNPR